jgi:ribosomal 50S subunit-recycling heat shock protein
MNKDLDITVSRDQSRIRLDRYLSCQGVSLSRNKIQELIASGQVTLNGQASAPGNFVKPGDRVAVHFVDDSRGRPVPPDSVLLWCSSALTSVPV